MPFCKMSNSHLMNSYKWLLRHPNLDETHDVTWLLECILDELDYRKEHDIMVLDKF